MAGQNNFAIEENDGRGYHRVHAAGCRDLKDPEFLGPARTWEELLQAVQSIYGEDEFENLKELKDSSSPCTHTGLKS